MAVKRGQPAQHQHVFGPWKRFANGVSRVGPCACGVSLIDDLIAQDWVAEVDEEQPDAQEVA